ncbi:hypothetical protein B0T26DRAFT_751952 [Lasiosphaeria miniovina]|uniref:Uncharacterized protein n=1 Tax=Lasiosphaeria miniovina TaxID=1954250 RepID=A0AA40DW94_9PEZI|nr:uncharacterized protein B0T26DRAFT_751952 [Lasiosphaeria miniovina]KAK0717965.1 hypothetical protein B0T26DRAFT_751952 [Lasiosphaeria miniovina]
MAAQDSRLLLLLHRVLRDFIITDDDEMDGANNPNGPVGIQLHISDTFTINDLERLRAAACDALAGLDVIVRHGKSNSSVPHTLTEAEARSITTHFFRDTVGTALVRVAAFVAEAEDYNVNLSTRAAEFNNDEDVPGAFRALFSNLAALKFSGGGLSGHHSESGVPRRRRLQYELGGG